MGSIYLVRHGITQYNLENRFQGHLDIPLSHEGVKQATKLARYLENNKIDAIYTSDLKRAVQTADYVAQAINLKLKILPSLREVDVGELEGLKWHEVKRNYPEWVRTGHNYGYPGGETRSEIERRVYNIWDSLIKRHSSDNIVLVTHGGIIKALICHLLGISQENRSSFIIDNCSVSTIIVADSGVKVKSLNNTVYLE
ncbi:MAG: histidine phosphatase family protein [Firmicutes bacterium]|nr:histidine phosphatase family protein [Bacillota bacterium]MDD4693910.1 histidine phosphatase family protein [Bacillota bacterium]